MADSTDTVAAQEDTDLLFNVQVNSTLTERFAIDADGNTKVVGAPLQVDDPIFILEQAEADADDLTVRRKLAQMAAAALDHDGAARWANQVIQINVMDSEMHRLLAEALAGRQDHAAAARQYEVVAELLPTATDIRWDWANACLRAEQTDRAREVLEELLRLDPDYPGATTMLENLEE